MKYKYKNKLKRFLKNFPNAIICQKKANLAAAGMERKTLKTINWKDDVYFYVNGGTKEKQVKTVNSLYIDLDAGRDSEGMYLPYSEVIEKKKKMLERINQFPLAPSVIIETRNGYHVYWLLKQNSIKPKKEKVKKSTKYELSIYYLTPDVLFKQIEKRICTFFSDVGADASTIKLNQIMRLPYSVWHKKYEGIVRPFFVKPVKEEYNIVYDSLAKLWMDTGLLPIKTEIFTEMSNLAAAGKLSMQLKKEKVKARTKKGPTILTDGEDEFLPFKITEQPPF